GDFSVNDGQFLDQFGKPCTVGCKIMGHGLYPTSPNSLRHHGCIHQTLSCAQVQYGVEVFLPTLTKRNLMSIKSLGKFADIDDTAGLALTDGGNDSLSHGRAHVERCGLCQDVES